MLRLAAVATAALLAGAANAGPLLSATYTQVIQGATLILGTPTGGQPTGTLVGNKFTLDAGNAFALNVCIGNPGNASCIANPGGPFVPPVTRINIAFGANGALSGTTAQANITAASGIMGFVGVMAKIGKSPAFTLVPIVVNAGAGGTATIPNPATSPNPSLQVQLRGDVWHIGAVTQSGLTNGFAGIPDAMGQGGVQVTGGGNTIVTLVSLGRTRIRGLANSTTSDASYLQLVYAPSVPEPGTLALLGAGVTGLALIGRRKLR